MKKHIHADAIDRIGTARVKAHFNISRQSIHSWRTKGVPKLHRAPLRLLAMIHGVQVPELAETNA